MFNEVILHIGTTKTGTTAIQTALIGARQKLKADGIHYPVGPRITKQFEGQKEVHGNAIEIVTRFIRNKDLTPDVEGLEQSLKEFLDGVEARCAVFSDEALAGVDADGLTALSNALNPYTNKVRIIFFLRHIVDHALSQYGEFVRRRRMHLPFKDFVHQFKFSFKNTYDKYCAVFGAENVQLVSFNAVGDVPSFFFKDILETDVVPQPGIRNRSLCLEEMELVRSLTKDYHPNEIMALAKELVKSPPLSSSRLTATQHSADVLAHRFQADLDYLNERLPEGQKLKMMSDTVISETDPQDRDDLVPELAKRLANLTMASLTKAKMPPQMRRAKRRMRQLAKNS